MIWDFNFEVEDLRRLYLKCFTNCNDMANWNVIFPANYSVNLAVTEISSILDIFECYSFILRRSPQPLPDFT